MGEETNTEWRKHFDERQQKEIDFAFVYVRDFHHGTDGHNAKLIIAKMAEILTNQEKALNLCRKEIAELDEQTSKQK